MLYRLPLLPVLTLVLWLGADAQNTGQIKEISSPQAKAQAMLSRLYSACSPAGYQASKINYALLDYYSAREDLINQPHPNQSEFEARLRMLRDKLNQKIQMVLSPEQLQMWLAYKEKEKIEE